MNQNEIADLMEAAANDDHARVLRLLGRLDAEGVAEFRRALAVIGQALDEREAELEGGGDGD